MRRDVGRSVRAVLAAVALLLGVALVAGCSSGSASSAPSANPAVPTDPTPTVTDPTPIGPTSPTSPSASPTPPSETPPSSSPSNFPDSDLLAPSVPTTKLKTITIAQLPAEARSTLQTIKDGGPFPYPNDGVIFENREKRLPKQGFGFYHEYTVKTPGSSDRGARRIVTGADGSRFWTADHYQTFREVIAS